MIWLVLGLTGLVGILYVWIVRLVADVTRLENRVQDLETGRPVKIEDGPVLRLAHRQDR